MSSLLDVFAAVQRDATPPPTGQLLRAATVAANPMAGEPAGTVGLYVDGDTSVVVPAVGGPLLTAGDPVVVLFGTTLVCLPVAGYAPYAGKANKVSITLPNGGNSVTQNVTFPAGWFTAAPIVTATNAGGTGSSNAHVQLNADPTTSGFTILVTHKDAAGTFGAGQSVLVHWIAVQMRFGSGAG